MPTTDAPITDHPSNKELVAKLILDLATATLTFLKDTDMSQARATIDQLKANVAADAIAFADANAKLADEVAKNADEVAKNATLTQALADANAKIEADALTDDEKADMAKLATDTEPTTFGQSGVTTAPATVTAS